MMNPVYDRHPLSALFGDMSPQEKRDAMTSIEDVGLLDNVIVLAVDPADGAAKVLDGWHQVHHRQPARDQAVVSKDYDGDDPAGYVLAKNLHRRHLEPNQRAAKVLAARKGQWTTEAGRPEIGSGDPIITNQQLADEAAVSVPTIKREKAKLARQIQPVSSASPVELEDEGQRTTEAGRPEIGSGDPIITIQPVSSASPVELEDEGQRPVDLPPRPAPGMIDETAVLIADLESEVRYLRGQVEPDADRDAEFIRLRKENRVLQTSLNTWQAKCNERETEIKRLEKILKETRK